MKACPEAIVIGTSAGGIDALSAILPELPQDFPIPVLIVVHIPPYRDSLLPELFNAKCAMHVKEAEDKESIEAATIYFAPPDYHLLIEANHHLALSSDEPILFSRPSIDVLFESAADIFAANAVGIILTGANNDGALGLRAIEDKGGIVLVQKPAEAQSPEMPQAALRACSTARSLDLAQIAEYLVEVVATQ
jgi:two-component system, chemotaxis family, protein-glutamate methylesterase/glutaminase